MNILFITTKNPYSSKATGGAETSIKLLAEEFARRGHKCTYLVSNDSQLPSPIKKINSIKSVSIYSATLSHRGWNNSILRRLGVRLTSFYLNKVIKQESIQIVYCFYELNILLPLLKIKNRDFKIVMRMAGLHWYEQCLKSFKNIELYQGVFSQVDSINFIHPKLKEMVDTRLTEVGIGASYKSYFIGDIGTSIKPGRSKSYESLENQKYQVIMAARFSHYQKRQDILVKAMSIIRDNIPIELEFIGEGSEKKKIESLAKSLGITNQVIFTSFTSQQTLWAKLQNADLLCHACEYEGLGKIIIESMALGLPVLASDVPPLSSYIKEGRNGYLVQNDERIWAKKIKSVLLNKKSRIIVSENSRSYIEENYSPEKNYNIFVKNFSKIL